MSIFPYFQQAPQCLPSMKSRYYPLLLCLAALLFPFHSYSQNLVNNPSFETISPCPLGPGQILNASAWMNPDTATPDLYNSCSFALGGVSVPNNLLGNQAALTGNGYAGFIATERLALLGCASFFGSGWREYLQTQLSAPLQAGQTYCVSFYVSLADDVKYATDDIGVHFANAQVGPFLYNEHLSAAPFNITPQLVNPNGVLNDAANWTLLQWSYTATGGERFMVIGNFNGDGSTTVVDHNCSAFNPYAYYYVEDVSVVAGVCALPVEFGQIDARAEEDQVLVSWETSKEEGIQHFKIERSLDGKNFEEIGLHSPAKSARGSYYEHSDWQAPAAELYYRIGSVDYDGSLRYSEVVSTRIQSSKGLQVRTFLDGSVEILGSETDCQSAIIEVIDASGKVVRSFPRGGQGAKLQSGALPTGLYILKMGSCFKKLWFE